MCLEESGVTVLGYGQVVYARWGIIGEYWIVMFAYGYNLYDIGQL